VATQPSTTALLTRRRSSCAYASATIQVPAQIMCGYDRHAVGRAFSAAGLIGLCFVGATLATGVSRATSRAAGQRPRLVVICGPWSDGGLDEAHHAIKPGPGAYERSHGLYWYWAVKPRQCQLVRLHRSPDVHVNWVLPSKMRWTVWNGMKAVGHGVDVDMPSRSRSRCRGRGRHAVTAPSPWRASAAAARCACATGVCSPQARRSQRLRPWTVGARRDRAVQPAPSVQCDRWC
jgi:hypothetical protein